jgi:hypothetical protein
VEDLFPIKYDSLLAFLEVNQVIINIKIVYAIKQSSMEKGVIGFIIM